MKAAYKVSNGGKTPMKLSELTTLTGMTWEEVKTRMQEKLEEKAYSPIKGIAGGKLTDINPAYALEVLTTCFGPCGVGWGLDYELEALSITDGGKNEGQNRWTASINRAAFWYVMTEEEKPDRRQILTSGGSTSARIEFAVRGALTSCLSGAIKNLLYQIHIYKNEKPSDPPAETPKDTKPASDEDSSELNSRKELWKMLLDIAEGDEAQASSILEQESSFIGKDGNQINGKPNVEWLKGRWLQITCTKVKKTYIDVFGQEQYDQVIGGKS